MAEENKATARRFYEELFNQGNLDAAQEIVTPDFVIHDPNIPVSGLSTHTRMLSSRTPWITAACYDALW